jgi:DNA-binding winged helix-turn-helix (wHTH) protein/tetratricopeptide (TPR) repeat protein/TolB-like protein
MHAPAPSDKAYRFGLFTADLRKGELLRQGVRVKVQDQPFRVLLILLARPGEIVSRDELRQKLWPEGTYVDFDGSLNVILKKLRATLDDNSDNPRFIETVPRRGYRFIAPVSVDREPSELVEPNLTPPLEASDPPQTPATSRQDSGGNSPSVALLTLTSPSPVRERWNFSFSYLSWILAVAILPAAALATWHYRSSTKLPDVSASKLTPVVMRKSVAVLGFHNLTGKADDVWLGTALSEMLSTELAGGEKLRLISGEDVANLRMSSPWSQTDTLDQQTTRHIGTALNTDLLVLGSYASVGKSERGHLRVDVRLQDAKSGEILCEIAEIGGSRDLFQIVSRIGGKLSDRLGLQRLQNTEEASLMAALPSDPEAARFYSLGIAKLRRFESSSARDLLEQAANAEPKFALAHAMLARASADLGYEQKRKEQGKKALELSATLPRADRLLVEGDYYESLGDHEKAASIYHALFDLFPDNLEYGLQLAAAQNAAGHASQSIDTLHQLRRLPPPLSDDPRIDLAEAKSVVTKVDALALIRTALIKSSSQGKKLVYARARRDECITLIYGDHPEQGPASCEEAYTIFVSAGDRLGAADCLRLIADRYGYQGRNDLAIDTYQHALSVLEGFGEHEKTGAILNNLAGRYLSAGNLDKAEQLYRGAKNHFEQAGNKFNAVTAVANLADVAYLRGDLREAEKLYQRALQMDAALDPSKPNYLLYRDADLKLTEGRVQEAHQRAEQAISAARREQNDYQGLTGAMIVLGQVLRAEGDLKGARQQFGETLSTRERVGAMDLVGESQLELAEVSLEEGYAQVAEPWPAAPSPSSKKTRVIPMLAVPTLCSAVPC